MKWLATMLLFVAGTLVDTLVDTTVAAEPQTDRPIVRIKVTPEVVTIGEAVEIRLTLLVPTYFSGAPVFPSLEIANAIVTLPPDSSYPTSEKVNGVTWSGITRHYSAQPLVAARFIHSNQRITLRYVHATTRQPVIAEVELPPIQFDSIVPPGAESLAPYVAGKSLEFVRKIDGDFDLVEPGDAISITYEVTLAGMPAMFIPPLAPEFGEGYSAYPSEPEVIDAAGSATRREKVTLVIHQDGEFQIPGSELAWWNLETAEIETTRFEPIFFTTIFSKTRANTATTDSSPLNWIVYVFGLLGSTLLVIWLVARPGVPKPETTAFKALTASLQTSDPKTVYRALASWVEVAYPGSNLRNWTDDTDLKTQIEALSRTTFSIDPAEIDYSTLGQQLKKNRQQDNRLAPAILALPALNP